MKDSEWLISGFSYGGCAMRLMWRCVPVLLFLTSCGLAGTNAADPDPTTTSTTLAPTTTTAQPIATTNTSLAPVCIDVNKVDRDQVKEWQTTLNSDYNAGLVVDGAWGPKTEAATENARQALGSTGCITISETPATTVPSPTTAAPATTAPATTVAPSSTTVLPLPPASSTTTVPPA